MEFLTQLCKNLKIWIACHSFLNVLGWGKIFCRRATTTRKGFGFLHTLRFFLSCCLSWNKSLSWSQQPSNGHYIFLKAPCEVISDKLNTKGGEEEEEGSLQFCILRKNIFFWSWFERKRLHIKKSLNRPGPWHLSDINLNALAL